MSVDEAANPVELDYPIATEDMDLDRIIAVSKSIRKQRSPEAIRKEEDLMWIVVKEMPNFAYNPEVDPPSRAKGVRCKVRRFSGDEMIKVEFRSRGTRYQNKDKDRSEFSQALSGVDDMSPEEEAFRWRIALTCHHGTVAPKITFLTAAKLMSYTEERDGVNGINILMPLFNRINEINDPDASDSDASDSDKGILAHPEIFGTLYIAYREGKLIDFLSGNSTVVTTIINNIGLLKACFESFDAVEDSRSRLNGAVGSGVASGTIKPSAIDATQDSKA